MRQSRKNPYFVAIKLLCRMRRDRKGMVIKNADTYTRSVVLQTRTLVLRPGESTPVTSDEVMDPKLRDLLQTRDLAIVRPLSEAEEVAIRKSLGVPPPVRGRTRTRR